MKIFYVRDILEKIDEQVAIASVQGKKIDYIELNKEEMFEFLQLSGFEPHRYKVMYPCVANYNDDIEVRYEWEDNV